MKILVAIDGSECSAKAVDFILGRPWLKEDQFLVVSVVEPIPAEFGLGHLPEGVGTIEDQLFEECTKVTSEAGLKLQEKLPDNKVEAKVLTGAVADQICHCANDWYADQVILGSHGRKGFQHFLLGSVAEEVMKKAACTVQVVKARETVKQEEPARAGAANAQPCAG